MHVIGTAGHVDHGKSTLIEALTGVHPDRLKEEKQREMTIDLGFGWLSLENNQEVGIVDVPGHIDFIGNLLSGIGGIDAVLFVIAADEGIMPQTREHEAIIRLLQIPGGLIVITKSDLVNDSEIMVLLKEEIRDLFSGSSLANAPILEVSAKTGQGIDALKHEISGMVISLPAKPDLGRPRLPVDRVFQLKGIGTVVTGTLQDGHFSTGDSIVISPHVIKGRIRELQIHGKNVVKAGPGNRVAVNISGVAKTDIQRGDVVVLPQKYKATQRLDVYLKSLPNLSKPLGHNSHVQFFIGAKSVEARVRVLGMKQLMPGESGFLQLEVDEPIIAIRKDRLILRHYSPGETIGGGIVLDAHPAGRHKRFQEDILNQLSALLEDNPTELVSSYLLEKGMSEFSTICSALNQSETVVLQTINELVENNQALILNKGFENQHKWLVVHIKYWKKKQDELIHFLESFHSENPILRGASLIQLRDHLKCNEILLSDVLQDALVNEEIEEVDQHIYAKKGYTVNLSSQQTTALERVTTSLRGQGHKPPSLKEIQTQIGQKMLSDFVQAGLLIRVSDDLIYLPDQINSYARWVEKYFEKEEKLQLADFRDAFQTSRKYAQALLEYFDRIHVTERIDDYRILYRK